MERGKKNININNRLMKIIIAINLLALICWSCSPKSESSDSSIESDYEEWTGMDEFHMIMAESFHPYRDSLNLEPTKRYAEEMVVLADQWISNELPGKVDNEEVKNLLKELKIAVDALADLIKTGSDEDIGTSITNVHDVFHHLQEAWYQKEHSDGE